uniref:glutamate synthase (ferredoxin) n=1 Tax=Heterorhabditis bacteriophora TaxID=37862 RepID=A0A1I7X8Q7_HETBA
MVILTKAQQDEAAKEGLWLPQLERDACGVGFVCSVKGVKTHKILCEARTMLERMAHRGACGCDNDSGDGAGVLTSIPDELYRKAVKNQDNLDLPPVGQYATGLLFLNADSYKQAKQSVDCYVCSLSSTTIIYKLYNFYDDLTNPDFVTHLALVHSRFSTNTFPSWNRAQPNRMVAHNGEINTLRGNINLMRAREGVMSSSLYDEDLDKLYPVGLTDSGCFDNVLEFLVKAGQRSLPEAAMIMEMSHDKRAFYRWADMTMEPWDGPGKH